MNANCAAGENIGLWPVRPAEIFSAGPVAAEYNSAGHTDCKSMFRHAHEITLR